MKTIEHIKNNILEAEELNNRINDISSKRILKELKDELSENLKEETILLDGEEYLNYINDEKNNTELIKLLSKIFKNAPVGANEHIVKNMSNYAVLTRNSEGELIGMIVGKIINDPDLGKILYQGARGVSCEHRCKGLGRKLGEIALKHFDPDIYTSSSKEGQIARFYDRLNDRYDVFPKINQEVPEEILEIGKKILTTMGSKIDTLTSNLVRDQYINFDPTGNGVGNHPLYKILDGHVNSSVLFVGIKKKSLEK